MSDTTPTGPQLRNSDPLNADQLLEELQLQNEDLLKRAAELLKTAAEWQSAPPISSEQEAEDLAAFMKQVSALAGEKGTANSRREIQKKPYTTCADVVQRYYMDKLIKPFMTPMIDLKAKANSWLEKKRLAAEEKRKQEEAAARAKLEQARTAEEVKAAAKDLKQATAPAKAGAVKSDFGASLHQTSRWDFDVVDITKVPAKFLIVDRAAVMAYIRTGKPENPVTIPGINVKRVTQAVGG